MNRDEEKRKGAPGYPLLDSIVKESIYGDPRQGINREKAAREREVDEAIAERRRYRKSFQHTYNDTTLGNYKDIGNIAAERQDSSPGSLGRFTEEEVAEGIKRYKREDNKSINARDAEDRRKRAGRYVIDTDTPEGKDNYADNLRKQGVADITKIDPSVSFKGGARQLAGAKKNQGNPNTIRNVTGRGGR